MPAIGGGIEHARAAAVDDGDAALPPILGGRLGDTPCSGAAVHPDVLDVELGALAHGVFGDRRPGSDHDRFDAAGDRAHVMVRGITFDLVGVRIDGEDLIPPLAEALVDDVTSMAVGLPRDAGNGNALVGEKLAGAARASLAAPRKP